MSIIVFSIQFELINLINSFSLGYIIDSDNSLTKKEVKKNYSEYVRKVLPGHSNVSFQNLQKRVQLIRGKQNLDRNHIKLDGVNIMRATLRCQTYFTTKETVQFFFGFVQEKACEK